LFFASGLLMGQTPGPSATTNAATGVTSSYATLNGTVNANGETTTVYFEYGPTASYGRTEQAVPGTVTGNTNTAVSATIYELLSNTTYHYRVVATNASGTDYGADMTFTTLLDPPNVLTFAATNLGVDSATLNGSVHPNGGTATVTFQYGTTTAYGTTVTADQSPVSGNVAYNVSKTITGLSSGTTYHYRVVGTNAGGTSYGADITFTLSAAAPTAVTDPATAIGSNTATLNGTVNANGLPTTVTFEYGLDTSYGRTKVAVEGILSGNSNTAAHAVADDVVPNTLYHFRVVATSSGGTTYGADRTFTTLPAPPTAVTNAATGITTTGATLNGTVNANDSSTTVTFEYGLNTGYGTTVTADQSPVTGSTDTAVSKTLTGLATGLTYHYRVVGTSAGGTTYGADMTFTTGAAPPTATTNAATAVGTTTATLNGTVNANGDSTTVTFEYGPTTGYGRTVTAGQSPVTGSTDTAVSFSVSDLVSATTYHYRVVAVNSSGTTYGADMTFFTRAAPTVTTNAATGVNSAAATLNGTVNANNDSTIVTFEYGSTTSYGNTVTADQSPVTGNTNTAVSKALTGLTSNTTYHYRVVGVNANGTSYGADMTFYTAAPAAPTATTNAATSLLSTGATLNGTVNANNASTTVTFEYGTTTAYGTTVTADQSPVSGAVNTAVSKAITGLSNNTTYHYRVVATNTYGTTYGADVTFSTGNAPSAITEPATNVGGSSATLNGTVNANNFTTSVSFQYGTTTSYGSTVTATPSFVTGTDDTAVSAALTGLSPNTTYHYRVRAQGFGTTYGADMTFTTGTTPSATTNAASAVSSNSATFNGTVNANNNTATVTFEYGLNTSYGKTVTADQSPVTGNTNTAVSYNVNSLLPNTTYHYRVVATTATDTVYGADVTFTTGGLAPTATTDAATSVTGTGARLNGTVNAKGDSTVVTFEYGLTAAYGTTVTASQSPVTGNTSTAVSRTISGLTSNTTYHFRVKAVNGSGTTYGADLTFYTDASGGPTATTNAATNVGNTGATLNGTVNANGNSTTVTFEFGPDASYGRTFTADQSPVTGTTNTAVSFNVSSLATNTTFHYRVVAQNSSGTAYGADATFTTSAPTPTVTTNAATAVTADSATLNGTVNANGDSTIVTFEYGTTTSYGSTVTADQSPVSGSSDTAVSADITGLAPNTTYHYRVKGQNSSGTSDGADMTFTTNASPPTVTTNAATAVTATSATLNGTVNANNASTTVTFQYGTTTSYGTTVTADQSPVSGTSDTAVSVDITGLIPNTTYHYRVVGQNSGGATDGADMTFTTDKIAPTVTTNAATNIGAESATLNGTVNANNDSTTVTFEYGTTTSYGTTVTAAQSPVSGSSDTAVSADITGLIPDTMYHYRAVGQNSAGTTYGADMTFTTLPPQKPTVTTAPVTKIGFHTAKSGGNVTDEGASPVTARGVVWSTSPNPTLADSFTVNDYGPGPFNSTLNKLTPQTTYYVRAYATNSYGTAYGEEFEFTTDSKNVKVTIIQPKNGASVSGTVNIHAVASANSSGRLGNQKGKNKITKVEFYIDNTKIAEVTKTPYKANWDTSTYADGSYTVKVVAYDSSNNSAEDSITVILNNSAPLAPRITTSRSQLNFKALPIGKKNHLVSAPQIFVIRTNGNLKQRWSITSDAGWLSTSPKSGKGPRVILVMVNPKGMIAGNYSATLTITDPNTSEVLGTVPVHLTVCEKGASLRPFGLMDVQVGGIIASNNVPLTGWVLDDIEVTGVKIYRSPLENEGKGLVYIGDAVLLDDARPEVTAIYPDLPLNYRAGWGFLLNTNSLPNQGNGTFTFYAEATDKEGNSVTLGSRTITVDNANSKKPFGEIDTLTREITAEGSNIMSSGWTLTPQPNSIPTDGSTITVWVDGTALGNPVYNQYRKDIASMFPNHSNTDGAGVQFFFDTSSFINGTHTITWSVDDNAGNNDVIGAHYFSIDNPENPGNWAPLGLSVDTIGDLENALPLNTEPGFFKKGYSPEGETGVLNRDENGIGTVTIAELERIELKLGDDVTGTWGYLVTGDRLTDLPAGSTLNPQSGIFSWTPGPGYFGNYLIAFITKDTEGNYSRTLIRVTIEQK
jgi:phosphodiesterase/alkaline phosphatase D-like protein